MSQRDLEKVDPQLLSPGELVAHYDRCSGWVNLSVVRPKYDGESDRAKRVRDRAYDELIRRMEAASATLVGANRPD